MHWQDSLCICLAMILALWADHDAGAALRAGLVAFLASTPGWKRSYDLRVLFGPMVYKALHQLWRRDVLERKEEPDAEGVRGGRENVYYRLKRPLA